MIFGSAACTRFHDKKTFCAWKESPEQRNQDIKAILATLNEKIEEIRKFERATSPRMLEILTPIDSKETWD